MMNEVPLLRFMVLSALIGFVVFCASYAMLVWKKRRKSTASPGTLRSRLNGWSVTAIMLGCLGILTTIVVRESVRAEGMLGGDGLYAIRASADLRVVQLAEEGPIKQGDVLARFTSPEALAEIQKNSLNLEQLKLEKENLPSKALPRDPELARRDNLVESKYDHLLQALASVKTSRETASRENLPHMSQMRSELANVNRDLKLAEGDAKTAEVKLGFARLQLDREILLAKKQNISNNDLNDRQKEVGALEVDVIKFKAQLAATEEKQRICKESLEKMEKEAAAQEYRLQADEEDAKLKMAVVELAMKEIKKELADDTKLAQERRLGEMKEQEIKIQQAELQVTLSQGKIERRAPYDGRVIFRHASPGATPNNSTMIVMCPEGGQRFQFPLKVGEVDSLRNADSAITIELADTANNIEQRFPGRFLQATALTRDPGMALVDLDCQAPPETVAALAEGKPIKARFSWRPPLMSLWPFPVSLILLGLGIFGLMIANVGQLRPAWASPKPVNDDGDDVMVSLSRSPIVKQGDTAEANLDTISLRPDLPNIPRERPIQPWEHPVGVRLREAIIREDVSPELLSAVESAIEQQKDAVIVPMREALRRGPTVGEHARSFLDKLNDYDTTDELKLIEKRCLAQRVTFLMYTLGMDIPSKAGQNRPVMARATAS